MYSETTFEQFHSMFHRTVAFQPVRLIIYSLKDNMAGSLSFDQDTPTVSDTTKSLQGSFSDIGGIEIGTLSLDDPSLDGTRVTVFS